MEILDYIFDNFTTVEITFIALVLEVAFTLFLVGVWPYAVRLVRWGFRKTHPDSSNKGLSKVKKGLCYFYSATAVALFIGVGFSIHWQQDHTMKVWQQGNVVQIKLEIDQKLASVVQERDIRDLCFGLVKGNQTYSRCLSQSPSEDTFVLDDSAIFEIGSISKTFTYAAMIKVLNKHNVEINSPIGAFLPDDLATKNPSLATITWQQLATHTSGLTRMPFDWNWTSARSLLKSTTLGDGFKDFTSDYVLDFLAMTQLNEERGAHAEYSNLAVGLLGLLLSEMESKSYAQLIQELVVSPLNMTSTTAGFSHGSTRNVDAYGQYRRLGSIVIAAKSAPIELSDAMAGAGAVNSSLGDMMNYLNKSMQQYQMPIFQEAAYSAPIGQRSRVNLGWIVTPISEKNSDKIVFHDGATGGFRSYMGFDQSSQVGIVILANGTRSINALGKEMLKLLIESETSKELVAEL